MTAIVELIRDRYHRWRAARYRASLPWVKRVREVGLYPAYSDWIGAFAVDAQGGVWFTEHGRNWGEREAVAEPELQHVVRGVAALAHPHVVALRQRRAEDARTCESCKGRGVMYDLPAHLRHRVVCQCGGLGWVPGSHRPHSERTDRLAFLDGAVRDSGDK